MPISLAPKLEKRIEEKVQSGEYPSESELMHEAMELLEARDAWLREAYHKGLERGGHIPLEEAFARIDAIIEEYRQ